MYLPVVYASNMVSDRENLWQQLVNKASALDKAWLLMGDFNNVLNPKDKKGCLPIPFSHLRGFTNYLLTCGLSELHIQDVQFTWRRKGVDTHIDKVLANDLSYSTSNIVLPMPVHHL